jgi:hypothetical protein
MPDLIHLPPMSREEVEAVREAVRVASASLGMRSHTRKASILGAEKLRLALEGEGGEEACQHADEPHMVYWWNDAEFASGGPPVPLAAQFDNRADALAAAQKLVGKQNVSWVKVFRSDNENYTCWRWEQPAADQDEQTERFSPDEKLLIIARLARGKSKLPWRQAEEAAAIDKLMGFLDAALKGPDHAD